MYVFGHRGAIWHIDRQHRSSQKRYYLKRNEGFARLCIFFWYFLVFYMHARCIQIFVTLGASSLREIRCTHTRTVQVFGCSQSPVCQAYRGFLRCIDELWGRPLVVSSGGSLFSLPYSFAPSSIDYHLSLNTGAGIFELRIFRTNLNLLFFVAAHGSLSCRTRYAPQIMTPNRPSDGQSSRTERFGLFDLKTRKEKLMTLWRGAMIFYAIPPRTRDVTRRGPKVEFRFCDPVEGSE